MFLPLFVGFRFANGRRQRQMAKFISLSSILGIALGVIVLIVGLSAMNGFERELDKRVLGVIPSAEIISTQGELNDIERSLKVVNSQPNIIASSPNIILNGLLSKDTFFKTSQIRAIDPILESRVLNIENYIVTTESDVDTSNVNNVSSNDITNLVEKSRLELLNQQTETGNPPIIIGKQISKKLGLKLHDTVELLVASFDDNGKIESPNATIFEIVGYLQIGGQLDGMVSFVNINDARKMLKMSSDSASQISLRVTDNYKAQEIGFRAAKALVNEIGQSCRVHSWMIKQGHLYHDIQMVRGILYLALILIVSVASFNIISSLVMAINDKRSEIAILMSMGYKKIDVMYTFVIHGFTMGIKGCGIGVVIGTLLAYKLTDVIKIFENIFGFKVLKEEVYFINFIPSELHLMDVSLVLGVTLVIILFSCVLPSYFAMRTKPARELAGK